MSAAASSLVAALLAAAVLHTRNRSYRTLHEREERDTDRDGIPDACQRSSGRLHDRRTTADAEHVAQPTGCPEHVHATRTGSKGLETK
jgi:hypothetical protein